jgi:hypothetical protein
MRKLVATLSVLTLGAVMGLGVESPASAAGASQFGHDNCVENNLPANTTAVMAVGAPANPLPVAAPASGIITKAKFSLPTIPNPLLFKLKTMHATGAPNEFTVVSQGDVLVGSGVQTYDVRVPVKAGDLLGIGGAGALFCATGNAADIASSAVGDLAPGTTAPFTPATGTALPIVATVEPDADGDGFGDITQDQCPQSATTQSACPVIDSFAVPQGKVITVLVSTTGDTDVAVTGLAKVHGKQVRLKGGTQAIKAGALAQFKVKVPKTLKKALAALPGGKTIKVTLTATSSISAPGSVDTSIVRLPGTRR